MTGPVVEEAGSQPAGGTEGFAIDHVRRGPAEIWIRRCVAAVTGVAVLGLMLHTLANALMRRFANQPLEGTHEYVANWYFPAIVLLGLVLAQQQNEHMDAPILFSRAPGPVQLEWGLIAYGLTFLMAAVFVWFGAIEAMENYELRTTAGVTGVVVWPATFLIPLGFGLLAVQVCFDAARTFRSHRAVDELKVDPTSVDTEAVGDGAAANIEETGDEMKRERL